LSGLSLLLYLSLYLVSKLSHALQTSEFIIFFNVKYRFTGIQKKTILFTKKELKQEEAILGDDSPLPALFVVFFKKFPFKYDG
jgi:hypothetical protein